MKKYLLFAGDPYQPGEGGVEDLKGSYDTIVEAELAFEADAREGDWGQVVEHSTMEVVKELERQRQRGYLIDICHIQKFTTDYGVINIIKGADE